MLVTGKELIAAANKYLHIEDENVTAALSGRKNMVPAYARYGYKNVVWDVVDYSGPFNPTQLDVLSSDSVKVVPVTSIQFEEFLKYDQIIHPGVERSVYWKKCFEKKGSAFVVALDGNMVVGFGGIRPFHPNSHYICPLYADSLIIAKLMVKSLVDNVFPCRIEIQTIEPNHFTKDLIAWLDIPINYTLARQYTKKEVKLPYDRIYGMAESDLYFV